LPAVIESDQFTTTQRLDALAARGVLFRKTGRFDLAVVDFTEVLRTRISADEVYVERGMGGTGFNRRVFPTQRGRVDSAPRSRECR
jgi:lipoprotein NlpI